MIHRLLHIQGHGKKQDGLSSFRMQFFQQPMKSGRRKNRDLFDQSSYLFHRIVPVDQFHVFLKFHFQDQLHQRRVHRLSRIAVKHRLVAGVEELVDQPVLEALVLRPPGAFKMA